MWKKSRSDGNLDERIMDFERLKEMLLMYMHHLRLSR